MSEEHRTPAVGDWGRPLRKRPRGPVPGSAPSGAPAIGPVDQPVPVGGGEAVAGADAADRAGRGLSGEAKEASEWSDAPAYEPERRETRAPRVAREPDAEDLRERDLVAFMARGLVDHRDDVRVEILATGPDAHFELHVHPDDLGHVIGKQGRTARSLRLALGAAAARAGRRADLDIAD